MPRPGSSNPMWYSLLADAAVVLHLAFVLFVLFGGLLVLRWPRMRWLHLPAAAWGILVEYTGWFCPLTPIENWLRERAGQTGYHSDFIAHYLLPILYPDGLTDNIQVVLGTVALLVNLGLYGWLWQRMKRQ
jgi:Protein of Unknown function (DUF2784)